MAFFREISEYILDALTSDAFIYLLILICLLVIVAAVGSTLQTGLDKFEAILATIAFGILVGLTQLV